MTQKPRLTVVFETEVFDKLLEQRAKPEYARLSLGKLVNAFLRRGLEIAKEDDRRVEVDLDAVINNLLRQGLEVVNNR